MDYAWTSTPTRAHETLTGISEQAWTPSVELSWLLHEIFNPSLCTTTALGRRTVKYAESEEQKGSCNDEAAISRSDDKAEIIYQRFGCLQSKGPKDQNDMTSN